MDPYHIWRNPHSLIAGLCLPWTPGMVTWSLTTVSASGQLARVLERPGWGSVCGVCGVCGVYACMHVLYDLLTLPFIKMFNFTFFLLLFLIHSSQRVTFPYSLSTFRFFSVSGFRKMVLSRIHIEIC